MTRRLIWGHDSLEIEISWDGEISPWISGVRGAGEAQLQIEQGMPVVDILTVADGRALASDRLVHTTVGESLRYTSHEVREADGIHYLDLNLKDADRGIAATLRLSSPSGICALRSSVLVRNDSADRVVLRSVTSWSSYFGHAAGLANDFDRWSLVRGYNDWLGEGRWSTEVLRGPYFPELAAHFTHHNPRGELAFTSTGTWSTGRNLPVAGLISPEDEVAWVWEIEHNGGWRWEIGEDHADGYFALSGPTDADHQWVEVLDPGDSFEAVPVTIAVASDFTGAIAELTQYRRSARRAHPDNRAMPVVFNDYMNTLNGDPTTQKLLPLIDVAAAAGAETFVIDAGWYDDNHDWWDSVGEWKPSTNRFSRGLGEVIDHITSRGMTPGLWLEPEVVGVRSPVADSLPFDAFLSRHGERVVEQNRYHLDLRHPAAIAHLNEVIDRLVDDFGVGFFKLDYNINPGAGTDRATDSVGAGLLEHNRAHLAWIDSVLDRHPSLVLENCGSGAMRHDFAMLSRMQLQSTSDQQDFMKYPPIAAAAPLSMMPEQAASWAYPQPEMSLEEASFCLATGLLGRFYLSGYLNRMSQEQRDLVGEAVRANKELRSMIAEALPFWPLGLPEWDAPWTALGLATSTSRYITVWNRSEQEQEIDLQLPDLTGADITVRTVFPLNLDEWNTRWDSKAGTLHVRNTSGSVAARTIHLQWPTTVGR